MTALAADRETKRKDGVVLSLPMATGVTIYKGSLVCRNASGYAAPAADTASFVFAGVAVEKVTNSGADGAKSIRVYRTGIFDFATSGIAITNVGTSVYVVDDQTVNLVGVTTNDVLVGKITDFVSATEVWVDIQPA